MQSSASGVRSGSTIAIFSGRIVNALVSPVTAEAAVPSSTFDTPTNPATNPVAGRSYTSAGVPTCSIVPWLNTAMRSLIVSASSWSWVT